MPNANDDLDRDLQRLLAETADDEAGSEIDRVVIMAYEAIEEHITRLADATKTDEITRWLDGLEALLRSPYLSRSAKRQIREAIRATLMQ